MRPVDVARCCTGICALVGAKMVGPRTGRFRPNGTLSRMAQQSPALQTLGALILWVGWYGFNGGSVGSVAGGRTALVASSVVNTTIAAAASVLCTGLWLKIIYKKFDSSHLNNGILSGLVAISGTGPLVEPEGAFIVGVVASGFYMLGVEGLKRFKIDDVVQASAVHFMCGVWGLISAALLTTKERYRDVYSYGIFTDPGREDECCGREYFPIAHRRLVVSAEFRGCDWPVFCRFVDSLVSSKSPATWGFGDDGHVGTIVAMCISLSPATVLSA